MRAVSSVAFSQGLITLTAAFSLPALAVKLYDSFESKEKFYLAFQLASGGELFEKIASRGKFTEGDAANVVIHLLARLLSL